MRKMKAPRGARLFLGGASTARARGAAFFWGGGVRRPRFHARRAAAGRGFAPSASRGRLEAARETRPGREASRVHLHAIAAAGADGEGLGRGLNRALLCYLLIHRPLLFVGCARCTGPDAALRGPSRPCWGCTPGVK